jgi:hypothetical protein
MSHDLLSGPGRWPGKDHDSHFTDSEAGLGAEVLEAIQAHTVLKRQSQARTLVPGPHPSVWILVLPFLPPET